MAAFIGRRIGGARPQRDRLDAIAASGKEGVRKMARIDHGHLDAAAGDAATMRLVGVAAQRDVVRNFEVPIRLLRRHGNAAKK